MLISLLEECKICVPLEPCPTGYTCATISDELSACVPDINDEDKIVTFVDLAVDYVLLNYVDLATIRGGVEVEGPSPPIAVARFFPATNTWFDLVTSTSGVGTPTYDAVIDGPLTTFFVRAGTYELGYGQIAFDDADVGTYTWTLADGTPLYTAPPTPTPPASPPSGNCSSRGVLKYSVGVDIVGTTLEIWSYEVTTLPVCQPCISDPLAYLIKLAEFLDLPTGINFGPVEYSIEELGSC